MGRRRMLGHRGCNCRQVEKSSEFGVHRRTRNQKDLDEYSRRGLKFSGLVG